MALSLRVSVVEPDPIKATLGKFEENFEAFMKSWKPQFIEAMKQTLGSENQENDVQEDAPMDFEEVEGCQTQLQTQGDGDSFVLEAEDHQSLMEQLKDSIPPIPQVCDQFIDDKVSIPPKSDFSCPKLANNSSVVALCTNTKGCPVADKVFDKMSEPGTTNYHNKIEVDGATIEGVFDPGGKMMSCFTYMMANYGDAHVVAYNNVFLGEFMQPDWDMFFSLHPAADYRASVRAISGGPIYVSDDFGLLKIWNMNKCPGVLGVYNYQGASWNNTERRNTFHQAQSDAITGFIRGLDVHLIANVSMDRNGNGTCALYCHGNRSIFTLPYNVLVPVSLKFLEHEIFIIIAVKTLAPGFQFASFGLIDTYNAGGAIKGLKNELQSFYILNFRCNFYILNLLIDFYGDVGFDENAKFQVCAVYEINIMRVCPSHMVVAYTEDAQGDEFFPFYIGNNDACTTIGKLLAGVIHSIEWAEDVLLHIIMDKILQLDKVWLLQMGQTNQVNLTFLHEENDILTLHLEVFKCKNYILVASPSKRCLRDVVELYGSESSLHGVQEYRSSSGLESISTTCFKAARISTILIDDGIQLDKMLDIEWHQKFVPVVGRILRIERLVEQILDEGSPEGTWTLNTFTETFLGKLNSLADKVVGLKSIAAYHSGLEINANVILKEVEEGLSDVLRAGSPICIMNKDLINYIFTRSLEVVLCFDLSMQIHTGFGDKDLDLRLSTSRIVLLHASYPFSKEVSYLASVYNQVYLDFGLAIPKLSVHGMISSVKELLELAPIKKVMFSTDGCMCPETFYLGVKKAREVVYSVLRDACVDGDLSISEALEAVKDIFADNAKEFYKINVAVKPVNLENVVSSHFLKVLTEDSQQDVALVRILWVDTSGEHRCRVVPRKRFHESIKNNGVGLTFANMAMTSAVDGPADETNLGGMGEIRLIPDLSTKCRIPWANQEEMVLADMYLRPGEAWEYCPREVLRRVSKVLKEDQIIHQPLWTSFLSILRTRWILRG